MKRLRISKKVLAELPPIVAEKLSAVAKRFRLASFNCYQLPVGSKFFHKEGERYWYIYGDKVTFREMASEFTMGASETSYAIGASVEFPVGTTIICVSYFSGYMLSLYNVCEIQPELATTTSVEISAGEKNNV